MRSHIAILAIALTTLAASGARLAVNVTVMRYASGQIESESSYWHGEKMGRHRTWWPDGHLRSEAYYQRDVLIGEYRTFYATGAPYELRHYVRGHEEGKQQSWTASGELYLNYDVRHGRRYGLVNAVPCVETH